MSLDQDLKNAFERHARDAQPDGEAWQAVERRIRRAHLQRFVLASSLTVALIVAAAVFVPRIGTRPESHGFTNPSATPTSGITPTPFESPSAGPAIPAGWQRRVGVQSGFQLAIPGDWKGGWFEGTWDFGPKGLPGGAQDGDTFLVSVTLVDGNFDGVGGPFVNEIINGNRAAMWQLSAADTAINYSIEWNSFCPTYSPACSSNSPTHALRVTVRATNQQLWSKYEAIGKEVVQTIAGYDGSTPVHGTVASTITNDAFSDALVRFLDARVEGIGADEMMGAAAAGFYASNGGLYQLNGKNAANYVVGTATTATMSVDAFSITIRYDGGASRDEVITVQHGSRNTMTVISHACTGC